MAEDREGDREGWSLPPDRVFEGARRRRADHRTWNTTYPPVPGPDSPFYSPPPSSRVLRWVVAVHLGIFAGFTVGIVAGVVRSGSALLAVLMLPFWVLYGWWRVYRVRPTLQELARRRGDGSAPRD